MQTNIEKVRDYIVLKHAGQVRWDGSPYSGHPIEVARIAAERVTQFVNGRFFIEAVQIVALLHDVAEDVDGVTEDDIGQWLHENTTLATVVIEEIITALKLLNKNNFDSYLNFVLGAKSSILSRVTKDSDIVHNLRGAKKGSMKDKYEMALYILRS